MKETNNFDFINILIQLKRGQKNEQEKNKYAKNTITRFDDDSQSYIKEILDICSDGNKNNRVINNKYENFDQYDLNTINFNNQEIIIPRINNQILKFDNVNRNVISNNENFYKNFTLNDRISNDIYDNHIQNPSYNNNLNLKNSSNSLSPIRNNLESKIYNFENRNVNNLVVKNNQYDRNLNNTFTNNSEFRNVSNYNMKQNNFNNPILNQKICRINCKNNFNSIQQLNKQPSKKLETGDLIEITNRRKNYISDISSVDGYFRRRHLETRIKLEKIKKEKSNIEDLGNKHIPKINKKSREIVNRMCNGSLHNIQFNHNNKIKILKDNNNFVDNKEMYPEKNNYIKNINNLSSYLHDNNGLNVENNFLCNQEYLINSQPQQNNKYNLNNNIEKNSVFKEIGNYIIFI